MEFTGHLWRLLGSPFLPLPPLTPSGGVQDLVSWGELSERQRSFRFCTWHGHRLLPPLLSLWYVCFLTSQILPSPILHIPQYMHGPPSVDPSRLPELLLHSLPDQILSVHKLRRLDLHRNSLPPYPSPPIPTPQSCSLLYSTLPALSRSLLPSAQSSHRLSGPWAASTPYVTQQEKPGLLSPLSHAHLLPGPPRLPLPSNFLICLPLLLSLACALAVQSLKHLASSKSSSLSQMPPPETFRNLPWLTEVSGFTTRPFPISLFTVLKSHECLAQVGANHLPSGPSALEGCQAACLACWWGARVPSASLSGEAEHRP